MRSWPVDSEERFLSCYDATVADVHRYATRLTGDRSRAEDLVQDVYLGLVRRARAGEITEASLGWLQLAVRHRFLDTLRATDREQRRLRLVWSTGLTDTTAPDDPLAGVHLSDRERAALTLRYVDDLPVAEVGHALGMSVRATESLLARARARVRSEVRDA